MQGVWGEGGGGGVSFEMPFGQAQDEGSGWLVLISGRCCSCHTPLILSLPAGHVEGSGATLRPPKLRPPTSPPHRTLSSTATSLAAKRAGGAAAISVMSFVVIADAKEPKSSMRMTNEPGPPMTRVR